MDNPRYKVLERLRKTPTVIRLDGVEVAVGGLVLRKAKPPSIDQLIPEATEEQYLSIAEMCPILVKKL